MLLSVFGAYGPFFNFIISYVWICLTHYFQIFLVKNNDCVKQLVQIINI
jgi:hypothetical protein